MSRARNTPPPKDARSLPVLRALIDAVDHEVLQLLSRRNGLVAEIAPYTRQRDGRLLATPGAAYSLKGMSIHMGRDSIAPPTT